MSKNIFSFQDPATGNFLGFTYNLVDFPKATLILVKPNEEEIKDAFGEIIPILRYHDDPALYPPVKSSDHPVFITILRTIERILATES